MNPSRKNKLVLSRETIRSLSKSDLDHAKGAYINKTYNCPTFRATCMQTFCGSCQSVCTSCWDSDCCLMPTDG